MRVLGQKTLARIVRPLTNTVRPGGLVLGYHRIIDQPWDPLGLCVHPSHFRQQLEVLRELYTPISLRELVQALRQGTELKHYVALTFDDGYGDFIENALPMLQDLDMPATVFITTGCTGRTFWWDDVVSALDPAYRNSATLKVRWSGTPGDRDYTDLDTLDGATRVAREICRELSHCDAGARAQILAQLPKGERQTSNLPDMARPMSGEEIRVLARCPNIELGSHTVSHSQLASLEESEQLHEIETSKHELETLVAGEICAFSYPHGSISDASRRHLEHAGYRYACTSREAVVHRKTDAYALPRVWARDVGRERFRKWVTTWRGVRIRGRGS